MTDLDFVRRLSQMNIEWHEHPSGGFAAEINGVLLHLCGNEVTPINLTISRGFRCHTIYQPRPISKAPAGRLAKWVRKKCGRVELPPEISSMPDGRQADKRADDEELHSLLENLLEQAHQQYRKHRSSVEAYKAYRHERKQELYMQVIFGEGSKALLARV